MNARALLVVTLFAVHAVAAEPKSGQLPINGLKLHYVVYGELGKEPPLLLIPGAFMSAESMKPWATAFATKRAVIVMDQQGHGQTPDTSRKMSYEQFGDDAAALLKALKVERADVMGYSQGGGVALQLAVRHPKLVSKLVSMSATYRADGWHAVVPKNIRTMNAKDLSGTPIGADFKKHTPDPKAFEAYVEKMKTLNADDQHITDEQMRAMRAKTMIIVGDADGVTLDHALSMFKLRGGGNDEEAAKTGMLTKSPAARLVVLPATSHIAMSGEVKTLAPMITAFLDDAAPANPGLF